MAQQRFSGLYQWKDGFGVPFVREDLRLDVDGDFPLMAVSGTARTRERWVHWFASGLQPDPTANGAAWLGPIYHKRFGAADLLPYNSVRIEVVADGLTVTLSHPNEPPLIRRFTFVSPHFRDVTFEFDAEQGHEAVLSYNTATHPNSPGTLALEDLTIDKVFERAGFEVRSSGGNSLEVTGAGADGVWTDGELHDAMQTHFSLMAQRPLHERNTPRWEMWVLFAGKHNNPQYGGQMFDRIGAHRQGTAIFLDSFISNPPQSDEAPEAWKRRMAFWTAIHEMGHGFNLEHCWRQSDPWVELRLDTASRSRDILSFMNYPERYTSPISRAEHVVEFFKRFPFHFTNDELLYLRHAPESFVQMGNESFLTNHAFEQMELPSIPDFELTLSCNRKGNEFEFMEPVVVELHLANRSNHPQLIPDRVLDQPENLTVQVRRPYEDPMTFHPFVHGYLRQDPVVLKPGMSVHVSHFISAGSHGWMVDKPGYYEIQVALTLDSENVLSNSLRVRIVPPRSWEEEYVAQDFFTEDVARVLTFDGSRVMEGANDVLREAVAKFPERNVAIHAQVALQMPKIDNYKILNRAGMGRTIQAIAPTEEGQSTLESVLLGGDDHNVTSGKAAETLGDLDFYYYTKRLASALAKHGDEGHALDILKGAYGILKNRKINKATLKKLKRKITSLQNKGEEDGE